MLILKSLIVLFALSYFTDQIRYIFLIDSIDVIKTLLILLLTLDCLIV